MLRKLKLSAIRSQSRPHRNCLFKDVEKTNGAKGPQNSTPLGNSAHAKPPPHPKMQESRYFKPNHVAEAGARVSSP